MSNLAAQSSRVSVVPCPIHKRCFRWIVASTDGRHSERSTYAYATVSGARAAGEIRQREINKKSRF